MLHLFVSLKVEVYYASLLSVSLCHTFGCQVKTSHTICQDRFMCLKWCFLPSCIIVYNTGLCLSSCLHNQLFDLCEQHGCVSWCYTSGFLFCCLFFFFFFFVLLFLTVIHPLLFVSQVSTSFCWLHAVFQHQGVLSPDTLLLYSGGQDSPVKQVKESNSCTKVNICTQWWHTHSLLVLSTS